MKNFFLLLLCLISPVCLFGQSLENYRKAFSYLDKSITVTAPTPLDRVQISAKGTIFNLGHYDVPEKTRMIPVEESYTYFRAEEVSGFKSIIQNNGNTYIRSVIAKADSLHQVDYYNPIVVKKSAKESGYELAKVFPLQLLQFAHRHRRSLRYLGEQKGRILLSFADEAANQVTLYLNRQSFLLEKAERLFYDDRYGDTESATEYRNYVKDNGIYYPKERVDYALGMVERQLTYSGLKLNAAVPIGEVSPSWLPPSVKEGMAQKISRQDSLQVEQIAPNVSMIKIISRDNKVLIAEFNDYVALLESPSGLALNQQILSEVNKRYPTKPLRYVFVTHHHPDHAGGIRAYAGLPVTLVTTAGNKAFFEKMLNTTHTLGGTGAAKNPRCQLDFVPLDGEKNFGDAQTQVIVYEIGKGTSHTNEHLVFYFPQHKLLWSGDLLFFRSDGRLYPAGNRGRAVYDLIKNKKLTVERIYTSWPLEGQAPFGTVEELNKALSLN